MSFQKRTENNEKGPQQNITLNHLNIFQLLKGNLACQGGRTMIKNYMRDFYKGSFISGAVCSYRQSINLPKTTKYEEMLCML